MKRSKLLFTFLLPALSIGCWVLVIALPVAVFMFRIRHALDGMGPPHVGYWEFVRSPRFWDVLRQGLDRASWGVQRTLIVLDGPAQWLDWLVSKAVRHNGLMPWSWVGLTYPIFAVPAWALVGWGLDGLLGRLVVGWKAAVASGMLVLAAGMWLPEARIWMPLFAMPALGWWRGR